MQNNKKFIIVLNKHLKIFIINLFTIYLNFYREIYTYSNKS